MNTVIRIKTKLSYANVQIITQMLPVLYQTENIHVKFGATTVDAFAVESDDPTQTVYALISVTQQSTR